MITPPKAIDGWEDRLATIKGDGAVTATIEFHDEDGLLLTDAESTRLEPKLTMVAQAAQTLAYNMVKGTVKYEMDDYNIDTWVELGIDDATDALNYLWLLKAAIANERR